MEIETLEVSERLSSPDMIREASVTVSLSASDPGIIGFSVENDGEAFRVIGGEWFTEAHPVRQVRLAVVSATFRREAEISSTVNTILSDECVSSCISRIIVVDNGRTIAPDTLPSTEKVLVVQQDNSGCSGGVARGIVEALADEQVSHLLIMDDDIELETDAILRTTGLFAFARTSFAVAGTMLDLFCKTRIHESGACFGPPHPFSCKSLKNMADSRNPFFMELFLEHEDADYGAWWFMAFPRTMVDSCGLPLPFFIRIDDVEFGLRMKRQNTPTIPFPGIGVWHFPFYAKSSVWTSYYDFRNCTITGLLHDTGLSRTALLRITLRQLAFCALRYDYLRAELLGDALEHVAMGPTLFEGIGPHRLHEQLLSKVEQKSDVRMETPTQLLSRPPGRGLKKTLAMVFSLNGHVQEALFARKPCEAVYMLDQDFYPSVVAGHPVVGVVSLWNEKVEFYERNTRSFVRVVFRTLLRLAQVIVKFNRIKKKWRGADLSSKKFWQEYLRT